jgi:hypothetical protein
LAERIGGFFGAPSASGSCATGSITVPVDVEAELPDLTEVRDRATTINGQLTVSGGTASSRIALVLPIPLGVSA